MENNMAQLLGLVSSIGSIFGQNQNQQGGLTQDEMAALQFSALQEQNKLINFYSDAGIPGSSGLAYDLGSIPFQTAAAAGGIEQGQQATNLAAGNQTANQFAQLGTTLGNLNQLGTNQQTTNPDNSGFSTGTNAVPFTGITGQT